MWAQLIRARLRPGKEDRLQGISRLLRASEQPDSGLVRSTAMTDQKDPDAVYFLAVFESEAAARARENDPRREAALQDVRAAMAEAFEGERSFVDLNVVSEYTLRDSSTGAEDNVALFRRVIDELANKGNLAVVDEYFAPDFLEHEQLPPGIPPGREAVKAIFSMLHAGFPDLHANIEDTMAQDDRVLMRMTWHGTHTGDFMDIPATGKPVTFTVFDQVRIVDGKLTEHWGVLDMMAVMQQISPMPVSGGAG